MFPPKRCHVFLGTETDTIGEPGGPGCAGTIVSLGIQPIRKIFRLFSMMERTLTGSVGFLTRSLRSLSQCWMRNLKQIFPINMSPACLIKYAIPQHVDHILFASNIHIPTSIVPRLTAPVDFWVSFRAQEPTKWWLQVSCMCIMCSDWWNLSLFVVVYYSLF